MGTRVKDEDTQAFTRKYHCTVRFGLAPKPRQAEHMSRWMLALCWLQLPKVAVSYGYNLIAASLVLTLKSILQTVRVLKMVVQRVLQVVLRSRKNQASKLCSYAQMNQL